MHSPALKTLLFPLFVVTLAACGSDDADSKRAENSANAANATNATNAMNSDMGGPGVDAGGNASPELQAFADDYATRLCDLYAECSCGTFPAEYCDEYLRRDIVARFEGRANFDASCATHMLDEIEAYGCGLNLIDHFRTGLGDACESYCSPIQGTLELGESCETEMVYNYPISECGPGLTCGPNNTCVAACDAWFSDKLPEGGLCRNGFEVIGECAQGLVCDGRDTDRCIPLPDEDGATCVYDRCAPGLTCDIVVTTKTCHINAGRKAGICAHIDDAITSELTCESDADCSDGDACTTDRCVDNFCRFEGPPCRDGWYGLVGTELSPWEERLEGSVAYGGMSRSPVTPQLAGLYLDDDEHPFVAWSSSRGGFLRGWDGNAFVEVGASGTESFVGTNPISGLRVTVDAAGNPHAVWRYSGAVHYVRWDGTSWSGLGGSDTDDVIAGGIASGEPAVAVDGSGAPVIAFATNATPSQIYVRRWDGSTWAELDGSGSADGMSNSPDRSRGPSIAVNRSGEPVVAWHEDGAVWLRRFDGNTWVPYGNSDAGDGISPRSSSAPSAGYPSLTLDEDDNPVVAWTHSVEFSRTTIPHVYAKRWTGTAWEAMGGSASGDGLTPGLSDASSPTVATCTGEIWVGWERESGRGRSAYEVKRWTGSSWETLPRTNEVEVENRGATRLEVSADCSTAFMAWSNARGNVAMRKFDTAANTWSDLGSPLRSLGVLAPDVAVPVEETSYAPSIALLPASTPLVAFHHRNTGPSSLRVTTYLSTVEVSTLLPSTKSSSQAENPNAELTRDGDETFLFASSAYQQFRLYHFVDDNWQELATVEGDTAQIAPFGTDIFASWLTPGSSQEFHVAREDSGWKGITSPDVTLVEGGLRNAESARVTTADGKVYGAFEDDGVIRVWQFDGSETIELTAIEPDSGEFDFALDLDVDASGRPVLLWASDGVLHLSALDGTGWTAVDGGDDTSIPYGENFAESAELVVGDDGTLAVVWDVAYLGTRDIRAALYDTENGWSELWGSATDGGVSNSWTPSFDPGIAIDDAVVCVTWVEGGRVTMRCANR